MNVGCFAMHMCVRMRAWSFIETKDSRGQSLAYLVQVFRVSRKYNVL